MKQSDRVVIVEEAVRTSAISQPCSRLRLFGCSMVLFLLSGLLLLYFGFESNGGVKCLRQKEDTPSFPVPPKINIKGTKRRLPQCIIIGVRKGGTRALLEFLNLHPNIQTAEQEVHFFDYDDHYSKGLEWYRKRMPYSFDQQITIEKSPAYFITAQVPERIKLMNESVKLILIVREPITRAISDYTQVQVNHFAKNKSYENFEELVIHPVTRQVNTRHKAIRTSIYHTNLERWLQMFPRSQIHVVNGDALVKNPISELRHVEQFLGLNSQIIESQLYFNKTRGFYCMRVSGTQEKCLGMTKGRKHPDIDKDVIKTLQIFFHPHNEKFFEQIGTRFSWS